MTKIELYGKPTVGTSRYVGHSENEEPVFAIDSISGGLSAAKVFVKPVGGGDWQELNGVESVEMEYDYDSLGEGFYSFGRAMREMHFALTDLDMEFLRLFFGLGVVKRPVLLHNGRKPTARRKGRRK